MYKGDMTKWYQKIHQYPGDMDTMSCFVDCVNGYAIDTKDYCDYEMAFYPFQIYMWMPQADNYLKTNYWWRLDEHGNPNTDQSGSLLEFMNAAKDYMKRWDYHEHVKYWDVSEWHQHSFSEEYERLHLLDKGIEL